jgi:hypothetical protein
MEKKIFHYTKTEKYVIILPDVVGNIFELYMR